MKTFLLLAAILIIAIPVMATSIRAITTEESIKLSDLILMGRVVSIETDYDREGQIVRNITMAVDEVMKGKASDTFTFQAWGGTLGGITDHPVGEAKYRVGEKIVVQLENIDGAFHTLGLSFGKWNVVKDSKGVLSLKRDLSDLGMVGGKEAPLERISLQQMRDLVRKIEK